jgi:dienelactone hydrolase
MAEDTFPQFIRSYAAKLRADDVAPKSKAEWEARRAMLRDRILAAIGPVPESACDLAPRVVGTLERDGYRIEKIVFQSRPDVWVTATAYVPAVRDKVPAVLVVHGHWAGARRDPVVQARCLGLVKLGFFVLAADAFGSGERFTKPARGTYHGALYGSTLWPTGHTLLGMQVYDNRRAVNYLLSRKEVNGKVGITGASGGGNQSMYAGALDDRFAAVVPVCSVGTYQSYLQTACCVCEVLPGALTYTEEGDVLGLVAPRALLVMNASRDGIQFSPGEARKSLARAKQIYQLLGAGEKVRHDVFESGHDYNRPMREAMYGWMTLHLKGEGKGEPIPEPEHTVEKPEDLACFPNPNDRPKGFLTPPLFAARAGRELAAAADKMAPTHPEMWEANANTLQESLKKVLGDLPVNKDANLSNMRAAGSETFRGGGTVETEDGISVPFSVFFFPWPRDYRSAVLILDMDGPYRLDTSPGLGPLTAKAEFVLGGGLRATGKDRPKASAIGGAPDHNPAEHAVWVGRPLLGQWVVDALASLRALRKHLGGRKPLVVVGVGQAAIVAACATALSDDPLVSVVLADPMVTWVTAEPYATGTPMGLLAPGILKAGDIPHIAALIAPRRLVIAGGVSPQGIKLNQNELETAFQFTTRVYKACNAADRLTIAAKPDWTRIPGLFPTAIK